MRFSEEVYSLEFFKERDYVRKKCKVCGEYFWTVNLDREVCGESPCEEYKFIGRSLSKKKVDVRGSRETFLKFFEKRDHTVIKPYPVVARWRTDMFLTDASIVDFQPFVTSGIAPPPANPLVISQPCIRLVDIDKVGLTFGRHLTIFEMGGAHAFNYPDREIYWKEGTVRYYHEYVIEEFGIPEEEIIYKESIWSGGGNAGPCFETISYGLELATLVFMQYKTLDSELVELPIKTVDTGYGIERFAWFSQGTPSCFDAIYGEIYPKVEKIIPIPKIEKKLLEAYSPYTALVTPKAGQTIYEVRRLISAKSKIPLEIIEKEIAPLEKVYALLDYTKSIAFIISEGVVPSNVKVGYLARLLIRKAYRLIESISSVDKLLELIDLQINFWGKDFPHLLEMRDETLEIIESEINKFQETIKRGASYVEREVKQLKNNYREVPVEFLVRMYDERGLTPDFVKQIVDKEGVKASIPENFYELVASRHLKAIEPPTQDWIKILEEKVKNYPPTRKLYYEQPLELKLKAKVLGVLDNYVILDQTLFYPTGGGQATDIGILRWGENNETKVVESLLLSGGVILHKVEGPTPEPGTIVEGEVDRERRFMLMRHHTATHIILGAARRVLGKHAWQAGAEKEPEKARLDIYHHKRLTREDIEKIEREANKIIMNRLPVNIKWMDRNEAEKIYGFTLYQGGEVPSAIIRVVEIPGWDVEACGGIHCTNTEDVGIIKILKTERIQDGVERLIFAAGPSTLPYLQEIDRIVFEASSMLKSSTSEILEKIREELEKVKELRKKVQSLERIVANYRAQEISTKPLIVKGVEFYVAREVEGDRDYALMISDKIMEKPGPKCFVIVYGLEKLNLLIISNEEAQKLGVHAGKLAEAISSQLGGRSGGQARIGQGTIEINVDEEELRRIVDRVTIETLGEEPI
ncbi:MAG: alanine--tRNA ligase [Aigarchaeota archaeon]|nr:alanine--tRNA ligase [Aigarchaeota archaeon]MDW7985597.1 alanine--tRNA ligase [Nitrososphaerota archaeon]